MKHTSSKVMEREEVTALEYKLSQQQHNSSKLQSELSQVNFELNNIRMQVKDLITENTFLRGREKGTKHQLKLEAMELKKLTNRFTEMITEKDIEINSLKEGNKQLAQIVQ